MKSIQNLPVSSGGSIGQDQAIFRLLNQALTFTNLVATVSDNRIAETDAILVYYSNTAVAEAAGIIATWVDGVITFTAQSAPSSSLTATIYCIKPALANVWDNISADEVSYGTGTVEDALNAAQAVIAPVETSTTASQAYAIGEQFILNGVLYNATAAITAGGTITINGNCTASDTVTEQIDDLQYHVVATSAASGTIASKLSVLAAVYSTLTAEQKMGCVITIADTDFLHNFDIRGLFYGNSMSGSTWIITSLQLNNKKAYSTANGATPTDNSSVTNTFVYKLCTR